MTAHTSIMVSIQADSHQELVKKIEELHRGFCREPQLTVDAAVNVITDLQGAVAGAQSEQSEQLRVEEGPKQARRRGRPRKSETQEAVAMASAAEPESVNKDVDGGASTVNTDVDTAAATPATKDDVKAALNEYVGKHSMPEGRALVQKVCGEGVLSLSQIPEDKYAAVIAACQEA